MNLLKGFVPIKNTNMRYYINFNGDVYDDFKSRFVAKQQKRDNYLTVSLIDDDNERNHDILIHRLVLATFSKLENDQIVDHVDGNRQNNHFDNLRIVTPSQNMMNRNPTKNRHLYKGVSTNGKSGNYKAEIRINHICHYLGTFATPEGAAEAYNRTAIQLHGDFACLNDYLPFANQTYEYDDFDNSHCKSSRFEGVSYHKLTGKYEARAIINNKKQYVGLFDDDISAAVAINFNNSDGLMINDIFAFAN